MNSTISKYEYNNNLYISRRRKFYLLTIKKPFLNWLPTQKVLLVATVMDTKISI